MATFYNYLIDAGIDAVPASWCCVIVLCILIISIIGVVRCLIFPRKK